MSNDYLTDNIQCITNEQVQKAYASEIQEGNWEEYHRIIFTLHIQMGCDILNALTILDSIELFLW